MSKDSKGRKFNRIPGYVRKQNGKTVHVKAYIGATEAIVKENGNLKLATAV